MAEEKDTTYEGWRNRETWIVSLWLSNEEPLCRMAREIAGVAYEEEGRDEKEATCAVARRLESIVEKLATKHNNPSFVINLIRAALGRVDWVEVAEGWVIAAREEAELARKGGEG